jgi:HrpA-like RNA helicase
MLQQIGALSQDESITNLGFYLADLSLSKMMLIYGVLFKCLDPVLTIVRILSIGDLFTLPFRQEKSVKGHEVKLKYEANLFSDFYI